MHKLKRFAVLLPILGVLLVPAVSSAQVTQSASQLQSQINSLTAELQMLQQEASNASGSSSSQGQVLGASITNQFTEDLGIGSQNPEVTALQQFLINKGYLNITAPTGYFGKATQAALIAFQKANGIFPISGYFGSETRAVVNPIGGTTPLPEYAASVSVTSPSAGKSFNIGSTMNISWTPAYVGVAEIQLVSTNGGESPIIYSKIVNDDPIDYAGYYTYTIAGIPAGSYYVRLMNPENDQIVAPNAPGTVIGQSGVFTITAGTTTPMPTSSAPLAPTIQSISPTSATVGTQVTLTGTNFGTANTVLFNGLVAATNVSSNGTSLVFTLPGSIRPNCSAGEMCPQFIQDVTPATYSVTVMTSGGTSNSESFTVVSPTPTTTNGSATINSFAANPSNVASGQTTSLNFNVTGTGFTQLGLSFSCPVGVSASEAYCAIPAIIPANANGSYNTSFSFTNSTGMSQQVIAKLTAYNAQWNVFASSSIAITVLPIGSTVSATPTVSSLSFSPLSIPENGS